MKVEWEETEMHAGSCTGLLWDVNVGKTVTYVREIKVNVEDVTEEAAEDASWVGSIECSKY